MSEVESQRNFGLNLTLSAGNPHEGETTEEFHAVDSPMWQYNGRPWSLRGQRGKNEGGEGNK